MESPPAEAPEARTPETAAPSEEPRRYILIAEDNKDTRQSLQKLLEHSLPVQVDAVRGSRQ